MKSFVTRICAVLLFLVSGSVSAGSGDEASAELFSLLGDAGCAPSALTRREWTINTPIAGAHGELNWGDRIVFEQLDPARSIDRRSRFNIWRNGEPWISDGGWSGSCVRNGDLSVYVVRGEIELDGCRHELAVGRLHHDDTLRGRIELVFQDSESALDGPCGHPGLLHPGHAHGVD